MTRKSLWLLFGGLAMAAAAALAWWLLTAGSGMQPAQRPVMSGDPAVIATGKKLYGDYCASCHGGRLQGQPGWTRRDAEGYLPAPPHDASGHTWHHPTAMLFDIVKHGPAALAPAGYRSTMPGYGDTLTDEEIIAILSYIRSRWPADIRKRHDAIDNR